MNHYGVQAMWHWREWLLGEYAAVADPERSFTALGLLISGEVARLESEVLPSEYDRDEDFVTRVGHRGMARLRAEEMVLHVVLPAPDPADDEDHLPTLGSRSARR